MRPRWLILGDDLTGALDCAVAFAQRGIPAAVGWATELPGQVVVALETDSRRLGPAQAALRVGEMLERHYTPEMLLFKKIDSTLRGQPAAEIAASIVLLRKQGWKGLLAISPAFPETGRSLRGGRVYIGSQQLEQTALWARDHTYADADLLSILAAESLNVRLARLELVRQGSAAMAGVMRDALADGIDALICDATEAGDLDIIAEATMPLAGQVFWAGAGGLAKALARAEHEHGRLHVEPIGVKGGILFVVGSIAEASRAASAILSAETDVVVVSLAPRILCEGSDGCRWKAVAGTIRDALASGQDVLVEIAAGGNADLSTGADLVSRLGILLQPAAPHIGALFATGGETALAILRALGMTGVQLVAEIEAGVPLGLSQGALTIPVVTKAGAFGDARTLADCLTHLRRLRSMESSR